MAAKKKTARKKKAAPKKKVVKKIKTKKVEMVAKRGTEVVEPRQFKIMSPNGIVRLKWAGP